LALQSKNVALKISLLAFISLLLSASICHYKGDRWEEVVRDGLYKIKNDSVPDFAKETVDAKGIPFVYYKEQNGIAAGKQYNATIVSNYALAYYQDYLKSKDEAIKQKFFNCGEWLSSNLTEKDGYALYLFGWRQPWYPSVGVPYTSGMTSGRAIEVFTAAHKLNPTASFLQDASKLVKGFYISIDSGGFTYKEPYGWWYEEIADSGKQTPRILDGHIFAILGLHAYFATTKNDTAAYALLQGLNVLKHYLPAYDAPNEKIYYDVYKKVADKKYHRILTAQMKQLYEATKDPVFLQYYNKWNAPLKRWYVLRIVEQRNISGIILWLILAAAIFLLVIVVRLFFRREVL
jgi:hypothetical protein